MRTYPDFTWEYIVDFFESCRSWALAESAKSDDMSERRHSELIAAENVLKLLPKLQEHPQLGAFVPMRSLMMLRWFPTNECEIDLYFNGERFVINVFSRNLREAASINEEKLVTLDTAADEVYAFITQLHDD